MTVYIYVINDVHKEINTFMISSKLSAFNSKDILMI